MEINLNFVLLEELKEKHNGKGTETHIVIIRESKDPDSAFEDGAVDFHPPE